jgi:hypothetical protein
LIFLNRFGWKSAQNFHPECRLWIRAFVKIGSMKVLLFLQVEIIFKSTFLTHFIKIRRNRSPINETDELWVTSKPVQSTNTLITALKCLSHVFLIFLLGLSAILCEMSSLCCNEQQAASWRSALLMNHFSWVHECTPTGEIHTSLLILIVLADVAVVEVVVVVAEVIIVLTVSPLQAWTSPSGFGRLRLSYFSRLSALWKYSGTSNYGHSN